MHKNLKIFSILCSLSPIIGILQKKSNSFINLEKDSILSYNDKVLLNYEKL